MTTDQFLTNFRHIAMAPSGVMRLRELVLHLAVSGSLVPKKSGEGDSDTAIATAGSLKREYRAEYELRPMGSDRPIVENELAFEIPAHWKWERLDNIACYIQRGKGPKYDNAGKTRVVSQKCVQWSGFNLSLARRISDDSVQDYGRERFLVSGDILWNSTGTGTAGRLILYPDTSEQVVVDSHVTIIRLTNFVPAYVWCFLVSPTIQRRMIPGHGNSMVTGTTNQVELSAAKVSKLPIPCPPLAEQKRIVAKVDELMALCDQLETQHRDREGRFPVLSRTCHARFTESPTSLNLNRIFNDIGAICPDDLRKTILELAVRGKLIPQNLEDESAADLLERVSRERENIARMDKVRLPKSASEIVEGRCPYDLPKSWRWSRLGSLAITIDYGTSQKADRDSTKVPVYRMGNISESRLSNQDLKYVAPSIDDLPALYLKRNDILFNRTNSYELVGKTGIFLGEDNTCTFASYLIRIRLPSGHVFPNFFNLAMNAPYFRNTQIEPEIVQQNGQANFNGSKLASTLVPVPPLREQHRIVSKVEELMGFVDLLGAQQQERDKFAEAFAKACVASFTGTTQLERPEKMKAPKTELVSFVKVGKKPKADDDAPLARLLIKPNQLSAKALWQQSGLSIDAFYSQLKSEVGHGWIAPPEMAEMKSVDEN